MSIENPNLRRIKEILAASGSNLAAEIDTNTLKIMELPFAFRRAIADVLMDEFLRAGMTPDHGENDYGIEIETLVDALNLAKRF